MSSSSSGSSATRSSEGRRALTTAGSFGGSRLTEMSRRTERVNELLREEISGLLRSDLRDPRIGGIVTVTHVDVSPDLRHALAYVSVLGTDDERASTLKALDHARPFLRRELSRRLTLRYTPDVAFLSDTSMAEAQEMTDLMRKTAEERGETL